MSEPPLPEVLTVAGPRARRGRVRVPGDKALSHRALLLAALADGASEVRELPDGDDVAATLDTLQVLGLAVAYDDAGCARLESHGAESLREPGTVLDCRNSGTTMRMLLGVLAGRPFRCVLTGDASLSTRPMRRVVAPLRAMGATVDGRDDGEYPPLTIHGGALVGADIELEVPSAQVKSAILLAGLQARGVTRVTEPRPSRDHTERMLTALGVPVTRVNARTVELRAGAPAPFEFDVPGDPSSAAFLLVAAIVVPGSDVVVEDVALNPARIGFVRVLERMGASIEVHARDERLGEPVGDLVARSSTLVGTVVEGDEIPTLIDEIPILAVAAAFANGTTEFRDAGELRVKESDRIAALAAELPNFGVEVTEREDALAVTGASPHAGNAQSHGDHRIAMALAVLAGAVEGSSRIGGWPAVASSYPGFAVALARLGGQAE